MKKIYASMLYLILGAEVVFFLVLYVRGPQGIEVLRDMYVEQETMCAGVDQLQFEVSSLQREIQDWQKHPFHKEKIAREQLQMARPDDEVFYLT